MAGRRPKPSAIRELSGNPGHRKINKHEPKPTSVAECPSWLSDEGREEWNRLAGELQSLGLLTNLDASALAVYCEAYQRWRRATAYLAKHGPVDRTENGYAVQSPYVAIANSAAEIMRKQMIEFGMSPASRSKVSAIAKDPVRDEWGQFTDPLDRLIAEVGAMRPAN